MDFDITPVTLAEVEQLRELAVATFIHTYAAFNTPENMKSYIATHFNSAHLASEIQNTDIHYFFIRSKGTLAGYIKLNEGETQTEARFPNSLEIERIYVSPQHHGKGLGHALLLKSIEVAKERKLPYIWLGVWDQNTKAIDFYERNGFYKDGIHPFMLGDEPQRDYVMKLEVNS
ncbi:GNAT family N-acetyltransferase [Aureisphaera galaxeae]|uniref:GNAT family N-acetyltransferase n=1 Tax=Aureisphaera galaxeae TaxID=1538023 RepID=UPI0023504460|nr:GNAT family N-acetyltransferase [Aureisphaera galaxeae]MDC8005389.1 GNAT family N-acetyltransferase [Aureisphaera galaxeae]